MQNEIIIIQYADAYGLDRDWSVEQIRAESNGNPNAISSANAQGIAQFIPDTAARFGLTNPFDIYQSLDAWGQYMTYLLDMFGGDYLSALAGYNAGEGTVKSYLTGKPLKTKTKTINSSGQVTAHGIPPYTQTINYVNKIAQAVAYDQANGGVEVVDGLVLPSGGNGVLSDTAVPADNTFFVDADGDILDPSTIALLPDDRSSNADDQDAMFLTLAAAGLILLTQR